MYRQQNGRSTRSGSSTTENEEETAKLRNHINRLGAELTTARFQIRQLASTNDFDHFANPKVCWPEPDYPEASTYYYEENMRGRKTDTEMGQVIRRFSDLFAKDRVEIVTQLNCLPEFIGLEELQLKTIFSVIVLTFRSVQDSVERRRTGVWEVLESSTGGAPLPGQSPDADALDVAMYRYMYRRAKSEHGMANAKEVTAQIWKTLYDFPSLKTCTRFNRFILDCVAVVWDMVAGVEGRPPRLRLEYESMQFDSDKHLRFHSSSLRSSAIKRYVWPGLIESASEKLVHKGIVVT
uniref:Mitochondria-eating protein n=1 Tax=Plectus sambesii TaxID=2011161 RepID=A0A914UR44_9BILA